jgi:hypothetical protein
LNAVRKQYLFPISQVFYQILTHSLLTFLGFLNALSSFAQ